MLRAPVRPQMMRYGRRLRPQMGSESVMRPYSGLIIQGTCAIAFQVSACIVSGSQGIPANCFQEAVPKLSMQANQPLPEILSARVVFRSAGILQSSLW